MSFTVNALCRGTGKGYVSICADTDPGKLRAEAVKDDGTVFPCPMYRFGFPGEDPTASRQWGETAGDRQYSFVLVVPLFEGIDLTIRLASRESGETLATIPFGHVATRIRSRLTYRLRPETAASMRDIDQRRLSGGTYVYITGIYPVEEHEVSCRFTVRYPVFQDSEAKAPCKIAVYDGSATPIQVTPCILEDSVITDPHDAHQRIRQIVAAIRLSDAPRTLCICATPEHGNGNFTCIPASSFSGFLTGALDLTKHVFNDQGYSVWFEQHRATFADIDNQRQICATWDNTPLISIVTVVYNTPVPYLHALIDSLKAQSYAHFEVVFVNVSNDDGTVERELESINDKRFRIVHAENKSIADNTNAGIIQAKGDYIAFVDHDDVIEPDTLYQYMCVLRDHPHSDVLYCDEDLMDESGHYWKPIFKPAFNPDLLNVNNYITHMLMVSRHVLEQVELSPSDVAGAQDYDLTMKCAEQAREIHNVSKMLYHWRMHRNSTSTNPDSKPYAQEAGRIALTRHYERIGVDATVHDSELPFRYRTEYHWNQLPKVSIVIPTKDHVDVLSKCLGRVLHATNYPNFDVTLVENNSEDPRTFEYYRDIEQDDARVHVVTWKGTGFNYSAICNYGASQCDGELILFLNNDTEAINEDWLTSMVGFFARPEVGVVGAKLLFHDDLVQHGGIWASMDHCGYFGELLSYKDGGYMENMRYPWDCAAVTGACQMIRRSLFTKIGGLDEQLAVVLNDVDLCLKARQEGYLVVFNPQAKLYHNEHTSRGRDEQDVHKELRAINEQARFYAKWDSSLHRGEFINPNLNQYDGHFKLRW